VSQPPALLSQDEARAALAFLVAAGADVAVDDVPRRWLEAVPEPVMLPPVAVAAPAAPVAKPAPAKPAPDRHPALDCPDVPALLALLGKFPQARSTPPLLFHGAVDSGVWLLIDRPDEDPAHRETIDRMLAAVDLDWSRAALVSRLPFPSPGDAEPPPSHFSRFGPVLDRLVSFQPPRLVLALGQGAAEVAGAQARLASSRGKWFDWGPAQLLPSFHPRTMRGDKELKRQAFEHLKLFRAAVA
jgi:DNA polymerase